MQGDSGTPVRQAIDEAAAKCRAELQKLAREFNSSYSPDDLENEDLERLRDQIDLLLEDLDRLERLETAFPDRAATAYPLGR